MIRMIFRFMILVMLVSTTTYAARIDLEDAKDAAPATYEVKHMVRDIDSMTSELYTEKADLDSPALVTPDLGTPSAVVLTNATGTAASLTAGAVTNGIYTTDSVNELTAPSSTFNVNNQIITGVGAAIDPTDAVNLELLEVAVEIHVDYFFNATTSDLGGIYHDMTNVGLEGIETGIETAGLTSATDDQALNNYATLSGEPGVLVIPSGIFDVHIHAQRTAGNSDVNIYALIYSRTVGGVETLIATTETSSLVTTKREVVLHAYTVSDFDTLNTDRVITKLFANVGGGSGATVVIYQEGNTVSRLVLPTTTGILSRIFIRQDGSKPFTGNQDFGTNDITGVGSLAVDTDTLIADAATDRVGVNMTPTTALDITVGTENVRIFGTGTATQGLLHLRAISGQRPFFSFTEESSGDRGGIGFEVGSGTMSFITGGSLAASAKMSLGDSGNLSILGNFTLPDPGTSANSNKIVLVSDSSGTPQTSSLQGLFGADPYLRISVPNDSGTETAMLDLHDTLFGFSNDNTVDIGASGSARPKNIYAAGTITAVGGMNSGPATIPANGYESTLNLDADKLSGQIRVEVTTGTAGVVESDMYLSVKDGGDASGIVTDFIQLDGSESEINILVPLSALSLTPVTDSAANFAANFTGNNLRGGTFVCNSAGTSVLPVGVEGDNFFYTIIGAIAVVVDPNASDSMLTDGVQGADGANITSLSAAGDCAFFQYYTASGWIVTTNGWTPE